MTTRLESKVPADDSYFDRVREFPPHVLRDDAELDRAIAVVDELLARPKLSAGEQEYLALLDLLITDYEREHRPAPTMSGVELLQHLMEENAMTQRDVARIFDASESVVSEIMHGRRSLAKRHILHLAEHFGLPTDLFMRP